MRDSRVFIASSEPHKDTAESLASKIRKVRPKNGKVIVRLWWSSFDPGKNFLAVLSEECRRSDFAVVFLTKDDLLQRNQALYTVPRDNCVFEAGLFIGAFATRGKGGRGETERCHLVTSLTSEELPSDLQGISVHRFEQAGILDGVAEKIGATIRRLGPAIKPELECYNQRELLEIERIEPRGHLVRGAHVLINLRQPLELKKSKYADRVVANLRANLRYRYLFSAEEENARLIAELLHSLVGEDRESSEGRLFCLQKQIKINLIQPGRPFEFCIHNSDRERAAVCYLLRPDGSFVECCSGRKAMDVAHDASLWPACTEDGHWRQRLKEEINNIFGDDTVYARLSQCFSKSGIA